MNAIQHDKYHICDQDETLNHLFCFLPECADVQTFWQSISHQMFSAHTTPEKFKNATMGQQSPVSSVFKMFSDHPNEDGQRCSGLKEGFWKAPFSWRIIVGGSPSRTKIGAFSNFLRRGVDGPLKSHKHFIDKNAGLHPCPCLQGRIDDFS